jgi:hypothetical protein
MTWWLIEERFAQCSGEMRTGRAAPLDNTSSELPEVA